MEYAERYQADMSERFTRDSVTFVFGAVHAGSITLTNAVDAMRAWRDDDDVGIAWITDPEMLGAEPLDATFAFGVSAAMITARPGRRPQVLEAGVVAAVERRRREIGNEPVHVFTASDRRCVVGVGAPSWMIVGAPGSVAEVVLGVAATAKLKLASSVRVLRSGKAKVAGLPIARIVLPESGWANVDLSAFASLRTRAETLLKTEHVGILVLADPDVLAEGGGEDPVPQKKKKASAKPAAAPEDEPTLLARLVSGMNGYAADSFGPVIRFVSAERSGERIRLHYTVNDQQDSASAHWPEPVTAKTLRELETDLVTQVGRDTSEM